ncbi:MAG: hypothetical protein JW955_23560 [Sedimentisphaerales bacterium]|nr:hypothetical protein [Sedimentisphaerales bacterium]
MPGLLHCADAGVGLVRAATILDEPRLRAVAQRQLDWVLGCNPFYASTVWLMALLQKG